MVKASSSYWAVVLVVLVAFVGQTAYLATERLRKVSLGDRLERFYEKHAPREKEKAQHLLAKYGEVRLRRATTQRCLGSHATGCSLHLPCQSSLRRRVSPDHRLEWIALWQTPAEAEKLEGMLRSKYGADLPSENLTALLAADALGTAAYTLRFHALQASTASMCGGLGVYASRCQEIAQPGTTSLASTASVASMQVTLGQPQHTACASMPCRQA